jgi:hypothetical protein
MAELHETVQAAWDRFAAFAPWSSMGDAAWGAFTEFVIACNDKDLGFTDVEGLLIDGTAVDGVSDFLAGELAAGLEVGLRILEGQGKAKAKEAALAKLSPEERAALGLE